MTADEQSADTPLHLLKMAVGVDDIEHLRALRRARRVERGGSWVYTRNRPRLAERVLAGGSIYWVIRGHILVRQRIVGFHPDRDADGRRFCLIEVDETLVPTLSRSCRPFQGWRYLTPADAPVDRCAGGTGEPPPERMLAELRELGLI
jgi:hypothetical protein